MVQKVDKLKGKITENRYTYTRLAEDLGMSLFTLRRKINSKDSEFSISESLKVKRLLNLSTNDYLDIFFGQQLEFNSQKNKIVEL